MSIFSRPPFSGIEKKEKLPAKIELHFFRHSIKESNDVTLPKDELVKLSMEGRNLSLEKAYQDVNFDQAVAFGSPRVRTQETAGFVMTGSHDDITGTESLEELKEKLGKDLKLGSKIGIDERLNFTDSNDSPVGKALNEAYAKGMYVKFMIEESDKLAQETGDTTGANYSAKAGQLASLIQKYVSVLPRWKELMKTNKYSESLERYMGTHASVQEAFLAKLIEVTDGVEARDAFISMIAANGFGYIEGFEAEVTSDEKGEPVVHISYSTEKGKFKKHISPEILEQIIQK